MRRPGHGFNKAEPGSIASRATEDRELHRRIEAGRRRASEDAAAFDRWARNGCTARAELAKFNPANWPESVTPKATG